MTRIKRRTTTKKDVAKIGRIADRAVREGLADADLRVDVIMDVTCAHKDLGLDLQKLLSAPAHDFAHDIDGINKNLDRGSRTLQNCFLPRCAEHNQGERT